MISKMLKMQMLEDEDDLAYAETEKKARTDSTSDGRPAWMRTLHTTASNWLHLIPQTLSHLKRTVENIKVAGHERGRLGGPRSGRARAPAPAPLRACGRLRSDSGVRAGLLRGSVCMSVVRESRRKRQRNRPSSSGRRTRFPPTWCKIQSEVSSGSERGWSREPRAGAVRSCGRTGSSQTLPFTQAFSSL